MPQFNLQRTNMSSVLLSGAKELVDSAETNKTVQILFAHMSSTELETFSLSDLSALLDYCASKDVDVTTYRHCFYTYGSVN